MPEEPGTRVLVVDDQPDIAHLFGRLLTRLGYEPHICLGGEEAIARFQEVQPRIVLLDLSMPQMDGFEVARRIRGWPDIEQPVMIAVTGLGTPEDRANTNRAGFDRHVLKPVTLDVLREVLADFV